MDYNARMYSPVLGRFISADTIVPEPGNPQTLNRYSYVNNRPLNFTDPTGHFACPTCSALRGAWSFVNGASYQFANDMAFGLPEMIADPLDSSDAFVDGREVGRQIAMLVNMGQTVIGGSAVVAGMKGMEGGGAVAVTPGGQLVGGAVAVGGGGVALTGGIVMAVAGGRAASMSSRPICSNCGATNPTLRRSKGNIMDRQHIRPEHVGKDGLSAYCKTCTSKDGKFWDKSAEQIREFSKSIGLDPEKALRYTPEYGGEGHYSLFLDAFGADGKLLPQYADKIDAFFRGP